MRMVPELRRRFSVEGRNVYGRCNCKEATMAKGSKATADPEKGDSKGEHGGNRAGGRKEEAEQPKRSSQAAGKDPHRGSDQN